MPLIICEIDLNWFRNCVIVASNADQDTSFLIIDTKPCVPVTTLLTQDNAKLLEQLKSGFKRTINSNNYQSKVSTQNQYLDYLIDPSFQWVNRIFHLLFENEVQRTSYKQYCYPIVEVRNYNIMIDG